MRRHISKPVYAGGAQGGGGVEALGHSMADHRLPLFLQQRDQPLLLGNQRIYLRRFVIEKRCDLGLFWDRWKWNVKIIEIASC